MEMEEILSLLRRPRPLSPDERARRFQIEVQGWKNGDEVEVGGFFIARKPPYAPDDAAYYLLSPLPPGELKEWKKPKPYVVLRITESSRVDALRSGDYVKVRGIADAYRWGTLRMIHVISMKREDYSDYWKDFREYALTGEEIEELFSSTIDAPYDMLKGLVYSFLNAPTLIGSNLTWSEGTTFSTIKDGSVVYSAWEALKYIYSILPPEMRLRRERWDWATDDFLDLDFRLHDPNGGTKYYVPSRMDMLVREIPAPVWARKHFIEKSATFLTPRAVLKASDSVARLSEVPFILSEPIAYERNRELERLVPNLIATLFLAEQRVPSLNLAELKDYRVRFEAFLARNRREYGEIFEAMKIRGMVFETGLRYQLGARLLGSMARFKGRLTRPLVSDVILILQEILDLWVSELPERERTTLLRTYRHYVGRDKRLSVALSIFTDIEATSSDGTVKRTEFLRALREYGFTEEMAREIIEHFIAEGYLYEPIAGKLRLVR
ncbi:hypothetical protein [Thermococcus sp.]|uniref:hypothetical protein n=1 Tax=Thermococcus sp. TaxID=35749 RepID=UPI00261BCA4C|nr:hypothetical protein [Thermococcus sp.]